MTPEQWDAAMRYAVGALVLGAFVTLLSVLIKTNVIYTILCQPGSGLVDRVTRIEGGLEEVRREVSALGGSA